MQEVTVRIRFTRACLGISPTRLSSRTGVIYRMLRTPDGRIMFLPGWWRARFDYAAKVINSCGRLVGSIAWSPYVDGRIFTWKRTVAKEASGRRRYALHEAFRPGDVIGVTAVLPDGVSTDAFHELLTVVGTYRGISPFQSADETYGTFDVVSVTPTIRAATKPLDQTCPQSTCSSGEAAI